MKNVVITIARHFGSGGKTIGKMLSEDLGICGERVCACLKGLLCPAGD